MRQTKITDFIDVKELSSGSEPCQTTDDIGRAQLNNLKIGVANATKHKSNK